jgi:hypothetical protein
MTRKRKRTKRSKRNQPCPCGSGKKYKHCCEKGKSFPGDDSLKGFIEIPDEITTYLLDTCVWGELVKSDQVTKSFISYFEENNFLAGVNVFSLFELSRAESIVEKIDSLFLDAHYNIWIPLLLDELFDQEIKGYPDPPPMRWMPMSMIADDDQPNVMSKFTNDRRFIKKRDEYLKFGDNEFMDLEKFKENFPIDESGHHTSQQAQEFCILNALDFLRRYFPEFIAPFREEPSSFESSKLLTLHMRSILLFYKYYIHNQSPNKSDFMDFAIVSYVPYVDYFVTEKNVMNTLMHARIDGLMPSETQFIHVNDFIDIFAKQDSISG